MPYICIDCPCDLSSQPDLLPDDYFCEHWKPEHWEKEGFKRNFGDAAVMNWPFFEMMTRETTGKTEYLILAPKAGLRRPVLINCSDNGPQGHRSWAVY